MSVTKTLTARERRIARWFKQEGFHRPYLCVAAAKEADISYPTAAALLAMETGDASNIFGCDHGPGKAFCHLQVTKARVAALRRSGLNNGIGPVQLTAPFLVARAEAAGGAHRPYVSMGVGFRHLRDNWAANSKNLRLAFRIYNGSGAAAEQYATRAMAKRHEYQLKLEKFLGDEMPALEKRIRQVQDDLLAMGFGQVRRVDGKAGPATRDGVLQFKRMCVRHRFKRIDGSIGVETAEIIHRHRTKHKGTATAHYKFREFASVTRGTCRGNGHIKGHRDLIAGLEKLRGKIGRPLPIVNGHRDPTKNVCVGGAKHSQHLYGNAADCAPGWAVAEVAALRCFSGIGFSRSSGLVLHVDVRHADPAHNFTGGTVANPTVWQYA